jgi:pilus assembly protein FimV
MQKKRPNFLPLIASLAVLAAADVSAMGFGKVPQSAVLGQALDFAVTVRLEPGEVIPPDCASAEVAVGDQRLSGSQVRSRIEGGDTPEATLRVVTLMSIDEPVVTVSVAVGCPTRLSRRFVLLADPLPSSVSAPLTYAAPAVSADPRSPAPAPVTAAERPAAIVPAEPDRRTSDSPTAAPAKPKSSAPRAPRVAKASGSGGSTANKTAPRLKLDAAEPLPSATAAALAASAAEEREAELAAVASAAAASAASAAADRISALERSLEKLRSDTQADRDAMATMRARTAESELMARWTPYLLVLAAGLLLAVAWLALKLRALNQERRQDWLKSVNTTDEPTAVPSRLSTQLPSELPVDPSPPPPFIPTRPGPPTGMMSGDEDAEPEPWTQRTQRLSPPMSTPRDEQQASRAVSIEELIDLEQQAEFFIVLGQEEAAIDLLVDHLRSTGGGSPLPYLKLLEIYKRRSEREAYDRTRARFNHRFNAVAPDWDEDVQQGRSLEDYPNIVARLQMAWPAPLDAMAELESLLFRKSRGELFDMPAYRDLLFLYSLSRDLLDREPVDSGNVDVLLPLTEGATFTEPMPLEDSPEGLPSGLLDFESHPTVPVDLDLTQPAMPDSIFGDPTEQLRRR